jgi:hypothetical protein
MGKKMTYRQHIWNFGRQILTNHDYFPQMLSLVLLGELIGGIFIIERVPCMKMHHTVLFLCIP